MASYPYVVPLLTQAKVSDPLQEIINKAFHQQNRGNNACMKHTV